MSADALKNSVRSYLSSQHMFVDDDWLTGCVEFLTEDSSNRYSETEIQNLAKEQWLLNDLKEICPGSLPANLKDKQKTTLPGRYTLQINAAFDIGTPAYQQYLKLQKVNTENIEATTKFDDKVPSHRMIKLYLTDGVQEISAIEYKPMRNLSIDITPGCKALIKGPVDCRRGVLLLTESNIELLGGEVQEIAISHSLPGLLASKLGLPVTQTASTQNTTTNPPRSSNIPTAHSSLPSRYEDTTPHFEELRNDNPRPIARVAGIPVNTTIEDDLDIDFDQIAAIEAQLDNPSKRPATDTTYNPDKRMKMDSRTVTIDSKIENQDYPANLRSNPTDSRINRDYPTNSSSNRNYPTDSRSNHNYPTNSRGNHDYPTDSSSNHDFPTDSRSNHNYPTNSRSNHDYPLPTNTIDDYPDDVDLFLEDEDHLKEMEASFDAKECAVKSNIEINRTVKMSAEPFVYIKQINDLSDREKAGRVFKVKAQIMKLLSKLSVGKDGWSLKCILVDGTGCLEVDFTSTVLSKLVGITPQEMNNMKKQMAKRPELREQAVTALSKAKDSLQVLYCIIELTMLDVPKITKLIPFDDTHVEALKNRTENSTL